MARTKAPAKAHPHPLALSAPPVPPDGSAPGPHHRHLVLRPAANPHQPLAPFLLPSTSIPPRAPRRPLPAKPLLVAAGVRPRSMARTTSPGKDHPHASALGDPQLPPGGSVSRTSPVPCLADRGIPRAKGRAPPPSSPSHDPALLRRPCRYGHRAPEPRPSRRARAHASDS